MTTPIGSPGTGDPLGRRDGPLTAGTDPSAAVPVARRVGRGAESFAKHIVRCQRVVGDPAVPLDHLSHYSGGGWDFTVGLGVAAGDIQQRYQRLGCQLSLELDSFDQELAELRSGRLFRLVLQAADGVVFCLAPAMNEAVVGVMQGWPAGPQPDAPLSEWEGLRAADRAMTDLVNDIRTLVHQFPQNFGGWLTEKPVHDKYSRHGESTTRAARQFTSGDVDNAGWARLCRDAVDAAELHYVGLFRDGGLSFSADVLHDPELLPFFTQASVDARRGMYRDIGPRFELLAANLGRIIRPTVGGRLARVVADVEQGAIYYYLLGAGLYLVAVTLDQDRVSHADDKAARLALQLQLLSAREHSAGIS